MLRVENLESMDVQINKKRLLSFSSFTKKRNPLVLFPQTSLSFIQWVLVGFEFNSLIISSMFLSISFSVSLSFSSNRRNVWPGSTSTPPHPTPLLFWAKAQMAFGFPLKVILLSILKLILNGLGNAGGSLWR